MSPTARERFFVGPGFVSKEPCPNCHHTRCGEDCSCDCDYHFSLDENEVLGSRIVRLKPRAPRSEADIRRDERLRIAGAFGERGILVLFNNAAVAEASGLSRTEIGAKVIQRAILAFDWKPEQK